MKTRIGFVSNSSTCSFLVSLREWDEIDIFQKYKSMDDPVITKDNIVDVFIAERQLCHNDIHQLTLENMDDVFAAELENLIDSTDERPQNTSEKIGLLMKDNDFYEMYCSCRSLLNEGMVCALIIDDSNFGLNDPTIQKRVCYAIHHSILLG